MTQEQDDMLKEIRRQGRAAVAAQSTAEACLAGIERLEAQLREAGAPPSGEAEARALLEALLPFFDALDRAADAAVSAPSPSWVDRLGQAHRRAETQARALRLLRAQLAETLTRCGVEVDREVGVPFDEDRHRVIERREGPAGVVEIILPGYAFRGRRLREAHVAAATGEGS